MSIDDKSDKLAGGPSVEEFSRLVDELTRHTSNWIGKYLFYTWTRYVSWLFVRCGISANAVTILAGVCMAVGSVLLAMPQRAAWVVGSLVVLAFYALDCCDGHIARYYHQAGLKKCGPHGQYLDSLMHGFEPLMAAAVCFRLYASGRMAAWPLAVGALAIVAICTAPYLRYCGSMAAWAIAQRRKDENFRLDPAALASGPNLFGDSYQRAGWSFWRFLLGV